MSWLHRKNPLGLSKANTAHCFIFRCFFATVKIEDYCGKKDFRN